MTDRRLLLFICMIIPCLMGAQELRIPEDSITIGGLFRHIEEQTPYTVAYSHAFLDPAKKISMPSSSGNIHLKDALSFLFGEMPYSYTINGSHIIILSAETDRYDGSYPEERSLSEERQFTFKGTACDRQSKERLEYATVCLLDADERMLSIGITGETGEFRLQTSRAPRKIKISFIGYETLMKDINGINENLGTFLMETTEQQLDEIIVSGGSLQSKTDRRTCHITPQMREGTFNAAELLDKIPGIHYDKYTQNFDVGNQSDILLLLDGMQQSPVYIKHFPSRQIRAIEIIREPSGRFISEGYGVIINLITEERMKGYDVFVSDISVANVAGGNGKDRLAKEQPAAGISLAGQRLTVYASGLYNREKWNMPMKRELLYDGRRVPFADNPNDAYRSEIINSTVGMNCRVNGSHTLAFHADYAAGNTYSEYMYMTDRNVLTDISNRTLKNMARNLTTARIAAGRLSYRGKMNNRLRLNSDFSFNYYGNDMDSRYGTSVNDTMNYLDKNLYNEYKNHTLFNMEASWLLSDRISADLGYSNSWRMYASESSHGKGFFDYNEDRHIVFAYLSSALSSGINIKSGLGVEMIRIRNRNSIDRLTYVMPRLNVRYRASSALEMEMNYTAVSHYPVMYQLSPMNIKIDSFLTQAGNPGLMPSLRHTASLRFRWKDRLTVEPAFHYTLNAVSESYMKSNYRLYRTFRNINTEEFAVYGGYGRSVGRYVRLAGSLTFYHGKTAAGGMENAVSGWLAGAEAGYYHPDGHFGVLLGFYRNMKKNVLWQGYQMLGKDNWLLEVNRMFPRTGIAVTLSWIPPLPYGIRKEQVKRMDTPLYSETTGIHLGAYHNTLLLKMNFRFGTGIKPANGNPASVRTEERQERTAGF